MYKPGDAYCKEFTTANPTTFAAQNADSLPVATANHNGTDDGTFTLTVNNLATGRYKITGTVPSGYASGDVVNTSVAATVATVAGVAVVDTFVLDGKRVSDLHDSSYVGGAVASVTGNVGGNLAGNVLGNVVGSVNSVTTTVNANAIQFAGQTITCAAGVTISPNVGTTQPLNFTGTAGSALVKSDTIDIASLATSPYDGTLSAVTGTTATLDVTDSQRLKDNTGSILRVGSSYAVITSSNTSTFVQSFSAWIGGTPSAAGYTLTPPTVLPAASDPLASPVPGSYASGTAGAKLANLDAAVSTRSTFAGGAVASVAAPVTVGTNNDKVGYSLAGPLVLTGQVVAGSTGAAVVVSGLPSGKTYTNQRLYHYPSGESRLIAGQSFASGNYTFTFTGATGTIGAPFESVTTNDYVSPV